MVKKKKSATIVEAVVEEQIDATPAEDVPTIQLDEVPVVEKTEPEPVVEPELTVEPVAEVEPQPTVEVVAEPVPVPTSKPKPLTLISLHSEIESLRQTVEQQSVLIAQLLEAPARQRKSPTSNGKIQIRDKQTGKIYPSKNNVYQSLLKAGELDDLVKQGVFGSDPAKNSFGCYNLFRAWPNRFEEVHEQEQSI
jgi:hypothetical protein